MKKKPSFSDVDINEAIWLFFKLQWKINSWKRVITNTSENLSDALKDLELLKLFLLSRSVPDEIQQLAIKIQLRLEESHKKNNEFIDRLWELRKWVKDWSDLIKRLWNIVTTDKLTWLFSKDYMDAILDRLWEEETEFFYLFLDLNNLKYINDTYGHQYGDKLIKSFWDILKIAFWKWNDYIFRVQWDEFVIISFDEESVIKNKIEIARSLSQKSKYKLSVWWKEIDISFWVWYAKSTEHELIRDMIHEADKRMYQDKYEEKIKKEKLNIEN